MLISGSVYEHVRGRVEASFVDLGERDLKNIARPVRLYRVAIDHATTANAAAAKPEVAAATRDRPSIAVLPFQNMSGDPEQDYFADGISEDIITALSKLSQLFVIARNSSFSFKGKNVQVQEIGKTLGVRYVLEGSVRKVDKRVRITAQLIDATNDGHLWAERFDRDLTDIFAVQDDVTGADRGRAFAQPQLRAIGRRLTVEHTGQYGGFRLLPARPGIMVCAMQKKRNAQAREIATPHNRTRPAIRAGIRLARGGAYQRLCQSMDRTSRPVRSTSRTTRPPGQPRSIRNCPPLIGL